jgi:hypothetical protein
MVSHAKLARNFLDVKQRVVKEMWLAMDACNRYSIAVHDTSADVYS